MPGDMVRLDLEEGWIEVLKSNERKRFIADRLSIGSSFISSV